MRPQPTETRPRAGPLHPAAGPTGAAGGRGWDLGKLGPRRVDGGAEGGLAACGARCNLLSSNGRRASSVFPCLEAHIFITWYPKSAARSRLATNLWKRCHFSLYKMMDKTLFALKFLSPRARASLPALPSPSSLFSEQHLISSVLGSSGGAS